MTTQYKTCGFVIKKSDISEADRIFKLFTEEFGKIEVLGRAIRKITSKLRAGIDIFSLSNIEFIQGKTYKTLTESFPLNRFDNIRKDLGKLRIAHKITETIDNLIHGQEQDRNVWDLINEVFLKLEQESLQKNNYYLFYNYFIWNFLYLSGYGPELYKCVICQGKLNPSFLYFSSQDGGIVCQSCNKEHKRINSDAVKVLRLILKKDWNILSRLKVKPFSKKIINDTTKDYYCCLKDRQSFI